MSTDVDIQLDEKIIDEVKEPSKYNVIILNDDVTPIDWVIEMLTKVFRYDGKAAENLTLIVHNEGSAVVGTYSYEIAEQKVVEATELARNSGFPLNLKLEQES